MSSPERRGFIKEHTHISSLKHTHTLTHTYTQTTGIHTTYTCHVVLLLHITHHITHDLKTSTAMNTHTQQIAINNNNRTPWLQSSHYRVTLTRLFVKTHELMHVLK